MTLLLAKKCKFMRDYFCNKDKCSKRLKICEVVVFVAINHIGKLHVKKDCSSLLRYTK